MATVVLSKDVLQEHNNTIRRASRDERTRRASRDEAGRRASRDEAVRRVSRDEGGRTEDDSTTLSSQTGKGGGGARGIALIKRKMSVWKAAAGRRSSISMGSGRRTIRPQLNLENTYKMLPDEGTKFSVPKVEGAIYDAIKFLLPKQGKYNAEKATQVSRLLSDDIKNRMKQLGFPRYKFVVVVNISENNGQCMQITSRALWDPANDNSATVVHKAGNFYVVATVFATYYE